MNDKWKKGMRNEDSDQDIKPNQASVLFERYTVWGVFALMAAALWFRNIPLVVISVFLFVISMIIFIWKRKSWQGLIPFIDLPRSRVFAGDEVQLVYRLANEKWWPLVWVEWEQPSYGGFSWTKGREEPYQIRLLWLMGYKQVTWENKGYAGKRGIYSLGNILLRTGDAFRFSEMEKREELSADLYVYPKLLPIAVPSLFQALQWGISSQKGGLLEDPSHISGIREYQSGDEFRKIHWQASARMGKLQTWLYKPVLPKQLWIVIDVRGFSGLDADHFERFLSILASVAFAYHKQGVSLVYDSNALDRKGRRIGHTQPVQTITPLLDDIAGMTASHAPPSEVSLEEELKKIKSLSAPLYYFCLRIEKEHVQWVKQNKRTVPSAVFYYLEPSDYSKLLPGQAKSMNTFLSPAKAEGRREWEWE